MQTQAHELPGLTRIRETIISGQLVNRSLEIDSRHLPECAALWASGGFTQLVLTSHRDAFDLPSLAFLENFPPITRLQVCLSREVDLGPLQAHAPHLRAFLANDDINGIRDFRPYARLESIGQRWRDGTHFPPSMDALDSMAWTHFRPAGVAIGVLPHAPRLRRLNLVSSNLRSLAGVERYPALEELGVDSAAQLADVSALRAFSSVRALRFEGCKALERVADTLRHLPLAELGLIRCGAIPSISFVQHLRGLRKLVFLDTDVLDGDMHALLAHPALQHVAFTRKKHFSHSERDVARALTASRAHRRLDAAGPVAGTEPGAASDVDRQVR